MKKLIIAIALCMGVTSASSHECLESYQAVWKAHHGAYATYSRRLDGHRGEKCWFERGERKVRQADTRKGKTQTPEIRPVGATRAAPITIPPKPSPTVPDEEHWPATQGLALANILIPDTPNQRVRTAFFYLRFK